VKKVDIYSHKSCNFTLKLNNIYKVLTLEISFAEFDNKKTPTFAKIFLGCQKI